MADLHLRGFSCFYTSTCHGPCFGTMRPSHAPPLTSLVALSCEVQVRTGAFHVRGDSQVTWMTRDRGALLRRPAETAEVAGHMAGPHAAGLGLPR
jgi:hypothetical protein